MTCVKTMEHIRKLGELNKLHAHLCRPRILWKLMIWSEKTVKLMIWSGKTEKTNYLEWLYGMMKSEKTGIKLINGLVVTKL